MTTQFTIGEHGSVKLNVGTAASLKDVQKVIAQAFGILQSNSITFEDAKASRLSLNEVKDSEAPVHVIVDHHDVRHPPGPKPLPFVGNFYEIYPDHMGNHERLFAQYGSVIKTASMGKTTYLTNDPDVSRFVLQESEYFTKTTSSPSHPLYYMRDDTALFTCDSASPAFQPSHKFVPASMSPKAVRHYTPLMQHAVAASFAVFDELDARGLAFHTYQYMFKLAGQIVYKLVLGMELAHFASVDAPPTEIIRLLGEYLTLMKRLSLQPWWYRYVVPAPARRLAWVKTRLWALVAQAIADRPRNGTQDLPLHDAALKATCVADYLCRAVDTKGEKLADEYVLSNCVVLVGAGFTTSASLLSWLIYALVRYPGQQERLLQELVDHRAGPPTEWSYDDIQALLFLDCFVKEVQRLHNPSFQTARNAKKDVILPGGYLLPKDAVIIPTFPSLHVNAAYWENPARFDPDRWRSQAVKDRHSFIYTPFATGGRGCIGFNVALHEAKLVLVNLVYRYVWEDASEEPLQYDPEFLVTRPLNFYARAVRRTSWPGATRT